MYGRNNPQIPLDTTQCEAFEAAFNTVARDSEHLSTPRDHSTSADEHSARGAVLVSDSQGGEPVVLAADADELSRTAAQLLESVRNEQSTKFRDSKFLELMRHLRDGQVRVEGQKMVEVRCSWLKYVEVCIKPGMY